MAEEKGGLPILSFGSLAEWENWLESEHLKSPGIWLKFAKQGSGISSVSKAEAIQAALCFGWIDGQLGSYDDQFWLTRFTPRKPKSKWSEINCKFVAKLMEEGRMRPAGLAQVELAQADGRWDEAYAPPSSISVPDDFTAALEANQEANRFFEALNSGNRYAMLYRLHHAKHPEKRKALIEKFVGMLSRGETIHPFLKPKSKPNA